MKRGFTIGELLIIVGILGVITAILFPVFARTRECCGRGTPTCQSNLKNIGLGFQQYLQDYNEMLPPARGGVTGGGWVDSLEPYTKSRQVFACPQSESKFAGPDTGSIRRTDYFMNGRLSRFPATNLSVTSLTVMVADGDASADAGSAHYVVSAIPPGWFTDTGSPRHRHRLGSGPNGGANFGFTDGHVKWYPADRPIGTGRPVNAGPTFAPR